jgi:hypothetical protein
LFTTNTFADAANADLMTITLKLKPGETLNNGETVSTILDSILFRYTVNEVPSVIIKDTATTTIWIGGIVPGDMNNDGFMDSIDLSIALTIYGKEYSDADWYSSGAYIADMNGDRVIDMADILTIAYLSIGMG